MTTQTLETGTSPDVIIKQIKGNLQVRGWERSQISVQANPQDLDLQQDDEQIRLTCQGNCSLRLPEEASLQIECVQGNAYLKNISELLTIGEVHGSLFLRGIYAAQIESIHGDLNCKDNAGDLQIKLIHGNASVRKIQGACSLEQVKGNIDLRFVEGDINVQVQGNAHLRLGILMGNNYRVSAEGNLHCQLPQDASLKFDLTSQAKRIKVRLPEGLQTYNQPNYQFTLGDGDTPISLSSDGSLYIDAKDENWEYPRGPQIDISDNLPDEISLQIASQIENQINAQMEQMTQEINEQISRLSEKVSKADLSPEETEHIMKQALHTSERETTRIHEKMRRAQEKLERKLEVAQRRHQHKERFPDRRTRRGAYVPAKNASVESKEPVSEEERLMILRMLEEKKITPEEAEDLLTALEGKG